MKISIGLFIVLCSLSLPLIAQPAPSPSTASTLDKSLASTKASTPMEIAKATLAAHGGDKLLKMKSLVVKGSVDLNTMGQAIPGAFSTAFSGEKYFFDINSAMQQLKQVFDGRETFSSLPGFSLPPVTSVGFPIMSKVGDTSYTVAALPATKKRKGFRITAPDGFYTDFYVDEKTSQIKGYESAFEVSGRVVTTSVEIDEFQTVEGVMVPKKYSQRFDLGQITAYANFKAKEILVNTKIEDSAFAIPK
ncbi:MAG: hypothetical protein ABL959_08015 [Pyrinomonadaceae bacterium]